MNYHLTVLDIKNNSLHFFNSSSKKLAYILPKKMKIIDTRWGPPCPGFPKKNNILPYSSLKLEENFFEIYNIGVKTYTILTKHAKNNNTRLFATSIQNINSHLLVKEKN